MRKFKHILNPKNSFIPKEKKRKKESGFSMNGWLIKQGFSGKYDPTAEDGDFSEKFVLDLAV